MGDCVVISTGNQVTPSLFVTRKLKMYKLLQIIKVKRKHNKTSKLMNTRGQKASEEVTFSGKNE